MPDKFEPKNAPETKPIKIESAKEPPKEVLDQTFSLSDMPKNSDVSAPIQLPPTDKEKKDEPKTTDKLSVEVSSPERDTKGAGEDSGVSKEGASSILKPPSKDKVTAKVPEKKEEGVRQVAPPDKNAKKERDYTAFSQEEIPHLKQMSNEAFDFTSKLIKQNKELSSLKDGSFLQHPEAYTLTPDYQQTVQQIQIASIEAKAWKTALIQCEDGKAFQIPTGVDKNGQLVMSEPMEPTAALKVELGEVVAQVGGVQSNLQAKLAGMSQNFKQRVTTDRQAVEQERSRRFAWVAKPEMLDWTVTTQSGKDVPIKTIKEDFKNLFPPYDRATTGVEIASDLMVAFIILEGELRNATAGKSTVEAKIEEVKRGEPSSDATERQIGEAVGGVKEFSLAGMPR